MGGATALVGFLPTFESIRRGGVESSINTLARKAVSFAGSVLQADVVMAGQTSTVRKTIGALLPPVVSSGFSITDPE